MVVNIASLPATDTFVTCLGRGRGPGAGALCGGRACAFAVAGHSAALQHSTSKRCKTDFLMKPVSVLMLAILALAQGLPTLFFRQGTGILPTYKASLGRSRKRLTFLRSLLQHLRRSEEHTSELQSHSELVCR